MTQWFIAVGDAHTNEQVAKFLASIAGNSEIQRLRDVDEKFHECYEVTFKIGNDIMKSAKSAKYQAELMFRNNPRGKLESWTKLIQQSKEKKKLNSKLSKSH